MPTQTEIRKFEQALQRARRHVAQYDEVSSYLNEAERCFKAECYRSAIVMLWCAVSARLNEDIERLGAAGFLESDRDTDVLRACLEKIGILTEKRSNILRRCLGDRNNCAHPSDTTYQAAEVIGYLQDLNQTLFGHRLNIGPETFKKILLTEDPLSPEQANFLITRLRINKKTRQLLHTLIEEYFRSSSPRVREKIRLIWQVKPPPEEELGESWEPLLQKHLELSNQEKTTVMRHLARKVRAIGGDHKPAEIEQIVFWEVLADDDASGAIYEYFLSQSEHLTVRLLHRLRKHAPDGYKEQFEAVLIASR